MQRMVAAVGILLCSCSTESYLLGSNPNALLYGVPGYKTCVFPTLNSQRVATLNLAQPVTFGAVRGATHVELIMPEEYHVQYERYVGKSVQITCELTESRLCGDQQIACAVVDMRVEP